MAQGEGETAEEAFLKPIVICAIANEPGLASVRPYQ